MSRGNRGAHLRAVVAAAILALALTLGALPAGAAVPRDGNTFKPRNGEELLEAADLIAAEGALQTGRAVVMLAANTTYEVDRPVDLTHGTQLISDGLDDEAPVLTHGSQPVTLLRLDDADIPGKPGLWDAGAGWDADQHVQLWVEVRNYSNPRVTAVEIRHGSATGIAVDVADGAYNVAGVALDSGGTLTGGERATLNSSVVTSGGSAPAVAAGPRGVVTRSSIIGGGTTLELLGGVDHGAAVRQSYLTGIYEITSVVLDVAGGATGVTAGAVVVDMRDSDGLTIASGTSIRVNGSKAQQARHLLRHLTLAGRAAGPSVRVESGSVDLPGLVAIASYPLVDCSGAASGVVPEVWLDGFYTHDEIGGEGCSLTADGRRSGSPMMSTPLEGPKLGWGSTARDGAPISRPGRFERLADAGGDRDLYGRDRTPGIFTGSAPDLGAVEYVASPPEILDVEVRPLDDPRYRLLDLEVFDANVGEAQNLTYEWWVDGQRSLSSSSAFVHTADYGQSATIMVRATDPVGFAVTWSGVLPAVPHPAGLPPGPAPPGSRFPREPLSSPRPSTSKPPSSKPKPTTVSAKLLRSRISASSQRRKLRLGAAARGEGLLQVTATRPVRLFVSAWKVRGKRAKAKTTPVVGARSSVAIGVADLAAPVKIALPARLGKKKLAPGLYELRIKRGSATGPAVGTVRVRVTR